jgi:hypothetical protein
MLRRSIAARPWSLALSLLVCLSAEPAAGVVVSALHPDATALAPGDDPGWNNVARRGNATAVYLGNRWVLTANHVGEGSIRLNDGRAFGMVPGSGVQLNNSGVGAFGSPDLRMFRLVEDPGLPTLSIASTRPGQGTGVTMIGAGRDRLDGIVGWNVSGAGSNLVWTIAPPPLANTFGYLLDTTSAMRWGTNTVSSGQILINNNTVGFNTRFDRVDTPFEAQAVTGDSGGGVFVFVDGAWNLAGIMLTQQTSTNQPANSVVFNSNQTQSASLASYRSQIVDLLTRADPAWQNQLNYFDTNRSGQVSAIDAMLIINALLRNNGAHSLTGSPGAGAPLIDVNGDGRVTSLDVQRIVNALLSGTANPAAAQAAAPSALLVPEPAGATLALVGLLCAVLARWAGRRR